MLTNGVSDARDVTCNDGPEEIARTPLAECRDCAGLHRACCGFAAGDPGADYWPTPDGTRRCDHSML